MNLICKLFGHNDIVTPYAEYRESGMNFSCKRCGKKWKRLKEIRR